MENNTAGSSSSSGNKPKNHKNQRPKKHRKRRTKKPDSSVQKVVSTNDLLTEILLRLPVLSLILFKSVSKHWLSLISFISNRNQFLKLDPPCGMFLKVYKPKHSPLKSYYEFVPSDTRVPVCRSVEKAFTFGPPVEHSEVEILQSCNGLLLCCLPRYLRGKIYVYNPSVSHMFKVIPYPNDVYFYRDIDGCLSLAFDPTKSPHYKVIYGEIVRGLPGVILVRIHIYSSETDNWSLCWDQFHEFREGRLVCFEDSVYWKDAIYWLNGESKYSKLDIMNKRLDLTTLPTPLTLDMKVHYECRLLESHGCLLLVGKDYAYSRHFTIYEKKNVYSEWSVKYIVDLDDILMPFPRRWSIRSTVFGIILGEREEDSLLVLKLDKKKLYNTKSRQRLYNKKSCQRLSAPALI